MGGPLEEEFLILVFQLDIEDDSRESWGIMFELTWVSGTVITRVFL